MENKIIEISENRYIDLLEMETRLAIVEDYLRYSNYIDKDVLKTIIGIVNINEKSY